MRVVLDDQHRGIAALDGVAVVEHALGDLLGARRHHARHRRRRTGDGLRPRREVHGQEQSEVEPLPTLLFTVSSPPRRTRDFAADGKTETRAAVFAAGGAVGLLEGFEDDALFFVRDADAGILDGEGEDLAHAAELLVGRLTSPR